MDRLKNTIRQRNTETILASILAIGGTVTTTEQRMVRAALIDVYAEREGIEAAEFVMQSIGM